VSDTRIVYGFHAVTSRVRQNPASVKEVYISQARHDRRIQELLKLLQEKNVKVMLIDDKRLDGLAGSDRHQGVVAQVENLRADFDQIFENLTPNDTLLALDGITDPHNLGACLRVADAMGVRAVIAPKDRAAGITPTVSKVASGAAETIPYIMVTNLSRALKEFQEHGIWIIGADSEAREDIFSSKISGPIAWVLGAEDTGLRRLTKESCDQLVRIPMQGSVESLNVSVSCGICLFESLRKRLFIRN
jgi:23S rRNA (guanosine2251-2'-O)-methyltransferase